MENTASTRSFQRGNGENTVLHERTNMQHHYEQYPRHILEIAKSAPMSSEKYDKYYNMNFECRGIALIFNHETFENRTLDCNGAGADGIYLCEVLRKLGFDVRYHKDQTIMEIDDKIEKVCEQLCNMECDCFLMAILTHGNGNMIHAKDAAYSFDILPDRFTPDKCPSLAGKPKIFLIQACQGSKFDDGFQLESKVQVDSACDSYRIPLHADFLIMYSTIPDFFPFRNPSCFIKAFQDELCSDHIKDYDLMTLLTFVIRRVAVYYDSHAPKNEDCHEKKQSPQICSTLTRLIKFTPKKSSVVANSYGSVG